MGNSHKKEKKRSHSHATRHHHHPSKSTTLSTTLRTIDISENLSDATQLVKNATGSMSNSIVNVTSRSVNQLQTMITKSPSLRVFVYTGATLSVLPLAAFGLWVAGTLCFAVMSAVAGVLLMEGGLVLLGLSILVPIEGAILAIAGATAFTTYASGEVGLMRIEEIGNSVFRIASSAFKKPSNGTTNRIKSSELPPSLQSGKSLTRKSVNKSK